VTIGGANEVKVYRRGRTSELVAMIPVGNLPYGIWPAGDGSRVYVALGNEDMAVAIHSITNRVIANIPIGQTTQALLYVECSFQWCWYPEPGAAGRGRQHGAAPPRCGRNRLSDAQAQQQWTRWACWI